MRAQARLFERAGSRHGRRLAVHMITVSKEDYLKTIAAAEAEGEKVISATLANWLSVTRPAVTTALRRLTKDGLARVGKDGRIELTSEGRRIAERTLFRHHLIERMLIEVFGMPWYAVHEEAERLEHAVSPGFEKKLVAKLGKNIATEASALATISGEERRKRGLRLMSEAECGAKYRISNVRERDRKLLEFLDQEGLRPGAVIVVRSINYDCTVTLEIGSEQVRLGMPAARKIW